MQYLILVVLGLMAGSWSAASDDALFQAARFGTAADVLLALDKGADSNAVDRDGFSPLLLAVHFNTPDVVAALLDADANVEYRNPITGLGIFAYVWRNPDSTRVHDLLTARGLFATVRSPRVSSTGPQDVDGPLASPAITPVPSVPEVASPTPSVSIATGTSPAVPTRLADTPFRVAEIWSGWRRFANVGGDDALIGPEVRLMLDNNQGVDIDRLTVRAEFLLVRGDGILERIGSATVNVVDVSDVPLRPGVREEVRLRSGTGFIDNNSPAVRDIKQGVPPPARVELYFRLSSGDQWTRFMMFEVEGSYRQ